MNPEATNGQVATVNPVNALPALTIRWDGDKQDIAALQFESKDFKSWPFVIALLDMARGFAKRVFAQQQAQALYQAQVQAQQQAMQQAEVQAQIQAQVDAQAAAGNLHKGRIRS